MDDVKLDMLKRRVIACFVDVVFLGALAGILQIFLRVIPYDILRDILALMVTSFFCFVTLAKDGPTWFIEALRGQSPGKKAMGLIVTKLDGQTNITFRDSIVRNIPLAVPYGILLIPMIGSYLTFIPRIVFFSIGLLGALVYLLLMGLEVLLMYKDPDMRRWGDKKAETRVVST